MAGVDDSKSAIPAGLNVGFLLSMRVPLFVIPAAY